VRADRASAAYRLKKFVLRNRWPVGAGAVTLLAIVGGAVGFAIEARIATAQRDRAFALAERAEAVSEFMNDLITEAGQSDAPLNVAGLIERSEKLARLQFQNNPDHRAAVLDLLGSYYYSAGDPGRAVPLLDEAMRTITPAADPGLFAKLSCDHGVALSKIGRVDAARAEILRALASADIGAMQVVGCTAYLGLIAQDQNDGPEALARATRALELLRRQPRYSPLAEATLLENLGWDSHLVGRNVDADRYYAAALEGYSSLGRGEGVESIGIRNNWAAVDSDAGDPRASLALIDETLAILARIDPDSPPPSFLLSNRAGALERLGRYSEARTAYERCADVAGRAHDATVSANCRLGIATLLVQAGDRANAEQEYARAAELAAAGSLQPGNPAAIRLSIVRALLDLAAGRPADAQRNLTAAIGDRMTLASSAAALAFRVESDLALGDTASARADADRALEIARRLQGGKPYSFRVGEAWLATARVRDAEHDSAGVRTALAAAEEQLSHTVDATQRQFAAVREWQRRLELPAG
jgi:tetratricopeptide (TPR) repeat protein